MMKQILWKLFVRVKRKVNLKRCIGVILISIMLSTQLSGIVPISPVLTVHAAQSGDYTYTVIGNEATITKYTGKGGEVVIPGELDGNIVVSVAKTAFRDNIALTSITFPASLTSIESGDHTSTGAFTGCTNLTRVTFKDSEAIIGNHAFSDLTNLVSINLGSKIKRIKGDAFRYCKGLTSIVFPENLTAIESDAFRYCTGLTSLIFPESLTSIGEDAFIGCTGLTSLTFPKNLTSIGSNAFNGCTELTGIILDNCAVNIRRNAFDRCTKLVSASLGNRIKTIGNDAFQSCGLVTMNIPASVTSIGNNAFESCPSLKTVNIGSGVTSLGTEVFNGCLKLENIDVDGNNPSYASKNGVLFNAAKTTLIRYPSNIEIENYKVPDGVTSINRDAFQDAKNLISVTFPASLTSIESARTSSGVFNGCTNLTKVTFEDSVATIGTYAFSNLTKLAKVNLGSKIKSIKDNAFKGCTGLTSFVFPESITSIGSDTFRGCTGLTSLAFSESITGIGSNTFKGCTGLTSLVFPKSLISIGSNTFEGCTGLTSLIFSESLTSIRMSAFNGCTGLSSLIFPESLTSIGTSAFRNCTGLMNITFDNCVVDIDNAAFYGCTGLANVSLGNRIKTIGDYAFHSCGLITMNIPASVTSISSNAFQSCASLTTVTIEGETLLGKDVFDQCTKLESIDVNGNNPNYASEDGVLFNLAKTTLIRYPSNIEIENYEVPEGVISISANAFKGAKNLISVTLPSSMRTIETDAFRDCTALTDVSLGEGVTSINSRSFYGCTALTSITFPASLTSIESGFTFQDGAFYGCTNLAKVTFEDSAATIGDYAFYKLAKLAYVNLGSKIKSIEREAFTGCTGLTSITFPESLTSLGHAAFSDCTGFTSVIFPGSLIRIEIFAFSGCTGLTDVIIQEGTTCIESYVFQYCTNLTYIEIPFSVTSMANDTFFAGPKDIVIYTWRGSYAENFGISHSVPVEYFDETSAVSLKVLDNAGNDITGQTTIRWYDADGIYIKQGRNITGAEADKRLQYTVELGSTLGTLFVEPSRQSYTVVEGNNNIELTLVPIKTVTISGKVLNAKTNHPVAGASVSVSQMLNDKYPKTTVITTDANGMFKGVVFDNSSNITVSAYGMLDQVIMRPGFTKEEDFGEILLSNSGALISLDILYTYSVFYNQTTLTGMYPDVQDLKFTVYNETKGKNVTNYAYQYPNLILPDTASAGDQLRITLTSQTDTFYTVQATVTLDETLMADASFALTQYGSVRVKFESSDNVQNVAILYDNNGNMVKYYDFDNNEVLGKPLPDGTYTLVCIGKSVFLNNIQKLSDLTTMVPGTDYIIQQISIVRGKILDVTVAVIPRFDESKLLMKEKETAELSGSSTYIKRYGDEAFTLNTEVTKGIGSILFTSSNEKVAAVEETTGKIVITGVGEAIITAVLAESKDYKEAVMEIKIIVNTKEFTHVMVSNIKDLTYTGKALTPSVQVTDQFNSKKVTLKKGTDYTVAYEKNKNAGTATLVLTGKGNYSGTKNITFKVLKKEISKATIAKIKNTTYTGKAIRPSIKITDKINGKKVTLKKGKDYKVTYKNNKKKGKATVVVKGIGNYKGDKKKAFNIVLKK